MQGLQHPTLLQLDDRSMHHVQADAMLPTRTLSGPSRVYANLRESSLCRGFRKSMRYRNASLFRLIPSSVCLRLNGNQMLLDGLARYCLSHLRMPSTPGIAPAPRYGDGIALTLPTALDSPSLASPPGWEGDKTRTWVAERVGPSVPPKRPDFREHWEERAGGRDTVAPSGEMDSPQPHPSYAARTSS